jgi:hypothetical protein
MRSTSIPPTSPATRPSWSGATSRPKTSLTTTYGTGFASSIAIGDLSGDGTVELVAPGLNGRLYVYRGDGQDAGNGTPILWTSDLVGPAAEPALADLDDDGKAEIIVSGKNGAFAFRHDGSLLWQNPAVVSYYPNESLGWGGPTVGNLDLDPAPEVVVAASDDALYVLDNQGVVVNSATPSAAGPPCPCSPTSPATACWTSSWRRAGRSRSTTTSTAGRSPGATP